MIEDYSFGHITIDGKEYTNDVLIKGDSVEEWWRKESHNVEKEDIKEAVEEEPELLVIGAGDSGRMEVPQETKDYIEKKGIRLVVEETGKAVETFNNAEENNKIAALHLTC
ncbi:hypothetical protein GF336_00165 [Candidatus Woesearchaeota archaeon]|nr:hypothetical protein [Candidatus Woesearchaeota archaeon]